MEGLSRLLQKDENDKLISGIKVARKSIAITHLLFVDDCLLFTKGTLAEARNLLNTINTFSAASGQMIKFKKSGIFFNKSMPNRFGKMLMRILKVQKISISDNYLGTPLLIGRSKMKYFDSMIHIFKSRLQNWSGRIISHAA